MLLSYFLMCVITAKGRRRGLGGNEWCIRFCVSPQYSHRLIQAVLLVRIIIHLENKGSNMNVVVFTLCAIVVHVKASALHSVAAYRKKAISNPKEIIFPK